MRKKPRLALSLSAVLLLMAAAWFGYRVRNEELASELSSRADRLLHPPLSAAGGFQDLRAHEARAIAEEAQAIAPSAARAALIAEAHSVERFQGGDYVSAERALAETPAAARRAELVLFSVALALAQKNTSVAEQRLASLSRASQTDPRAWLMRSDVARAVGRADAALAAADSGIELAARSAALHERRGLALELLGDGAQARAELEKAADLDRDGSSALIALGRVLRASGDLRGAVLAFHEASQRHPNDAEAWLGSGVCRLGYGDATSAQADLERAAELAPTRSEPLVALADADVAQGRLPLALGRYRAATLLDPADATARVKLGNALMLNGDVRDAVPAFRAAIEHRPDLAAAHNGLGAALLAQGDLPGSEDELKAAAKLDPADAHPLLNLARLYKRRGDSAALADAIAQAEARDPGLELRANTAPDRPLHGHAAASAAPTLALPTRPAHGAVTIAGK